MTSLRNISGIRNDRRAKSSPRLFCTGVPLKKAALQWGGGDGGWGRRVTSKRLKKGKSLGKNETQSPQWMIYNTYTTVIGEGGGGVCIRGRIAHLKKIASFLG